MDRYIIVDGGSQDDSIPYFRNWSKWEPKLNLFIHPWCNIFPKQRNYYIQHARELCSASDNNWLLVHDSDEYYSEGLLENIKDIILEAESIGANVVDIQDQSIALKAHKEMHRQPNEYWKPWLFKLLPETHYIEESHPHETLYQLNRKDVRVGGVGAAPDGKDIFYNHVKQEGSVWAHGARNALVNGGGNNSGDKSVIFREFKTLIAPYFDGKYPDDYQKIDKWFIDGNLPQDVKDFLIDRARTCEEIYPGEKNGISEWKENYLYYFRILHPEEEPQNLRGTDVYGAKK